MNKTVLSPISAFLTGIASIIFFAPTVCASTLDLALSNRTVKLDIISDTKGANNASVEATYLHNEGDRDLISAALHVANSDHLIKAMIGLKAYYVDIDDEEGSGIAIGGKVFHSLTEKLVLQGQLYYSPAVTSFGDTEHYEEIAVNLIYYMMPQSQVFIGYRNLDIDMEDIGDLEMHEGGYLGISFQF